MAEPRRTFGPVVLLGLAGGAVAAIAGNKDWVAAAGGSAEPGNSQVAITQAASQMPLAAALSLVILASWGALLVTRGVVRRLVSVLAVLAALGLAATVVTGFLTLPDSLRDLLAEAAVPAGDQVGYTAWFWAAAVGAVMSVVATVLAVRNVGSWPEMGSRYDAPGAVATEEPAEPSNLELWKAMDEGRDPTAEDAE